MTPLPENVELCNDCGCAPILPESVVLTTPKWVYRLWGECRCEPTEDVHVPSDIDGYIECPNNCADWNTPATQCPCECHT